MAAIELGDAFEKHAPCHFPDSANATFDDAIHGLCIRGRELFNNPFASAHCAEFSRFEHAEVGVRLDTANVCLGILEKSWKRLDDLGSGECGVGFGSKVRGEFVPRRVVNNDQGVESAAYSGSGLGTR